MARLAGFEWIPGADAGAFRSFQWKLVLHTTEGGSVDGAIGAYRSHGGWPHVTVDPRTRRRVQHVELDRAARALARGDATNPETNRAGAIQVEIVGRAVETPDWPGEYLDWLRHEVIAPIREHVPFPLVAPEFVPYPHSYGVNAQQRFSWDQWLGFTGVLGHQHVPANDHGDPGAIDVLRLMHEPEEDDMARSIVVMTDPERKALYVAEEGSTVLTHAPDPGWLDNYLNMMRFFGRAVLDRSNDEMPENLWRMYAILEPGEQT